MLIIFNTQTNIFINRIMNSHILFYFHSMLFIGNVTPRTKIFFLLPLASKKCIFAAISKLPNMMKRNLLLAAMFAMATFAGHNVKAQNPVFSYDYQGKTLYYVIDSNLHAQVVSPDYPDLHFTVDSSDCNPWYGHTQPQGAIVVPDSVMFNGEYYPVTALADRVFYYCSNIQSLVLPQSLTIIGKLSICECLGLQSVTFEGNQTPGAGSRIKVIDRHAFRGCIALQSVILPDSLTTLAYAAFYHCTSLQSVTFPDALTTIENFAFGECDALQSATLPNSLTTLGDCVFIRCPGLQSVTLPPSLTNTGTYAFDECTGLQSVSLSEGLMTIGEKAFRRCSSLQSIDIPASVNTIGLSAFQECGSLLTVTLHEGIDTIGVNAFWSCSSLTTINYPSTLKVIGDNAFEFDNMLATPVVLPEGFITLGNVAFGDCSSIPFADLPGSLSSIGDWTFYQCISLTSVTLHEGTERIGTRAFLGCTNLTTINYPSTLNEIDEVAFGLCTALDETLILPNGLTNLGLAAYAFCSNIVSASLPGTIGEIQSEMFYGCTSLSKVTIGEGITNIGMGTFNVCPNIDTLFVNCAVPPTVESPIDSTFFTFNSTVVVPCGSEEVYRQHAVWGLFSDIVEDCGVGIPDVDIPDVTIRVTNSRIEVEGAEGENVRVFDITGRIVRNEALSAGVYLVQIGNRPAEKVVVHPNM